MGKNRRLFAPKWQYIGLGSLAVATAVSVTLVLTSEPEQVPVSDVIASYAASPPAPSQRVVTLPAVTRPPVAAAVGLLDDPTREWTLTVLGDSTGNDTNEYVFLLAKQLSDAHNRPVIIHRWTNDAYESEMRIGAGRYAPLHIWNGSVPGTTGEYALDHLEAIAPKADLTILNYGHNYKGAWNTETVTLQLVNAVDGQHGNGAMLFMFQNPQNPETPDSEATSQKIREMVTTANYEAVDVYQAFKATGDIAPLMHDNIHPNPAGSQVWADAVAAKLLT